MTSRLEDSAIDSVDQGPEEPPRPGDATARSDTLETDEGTSEPVTGGQDGARQPVGPGALDQTPAQRDGVLGQSRLPPKEPAADSVPPPRLVTAAPQAPLAASVSGSAAPPDAASEGDGASAHAPHPRPLPLLSMVGVERAAEESSTQSAAPAAPAAGAAAVTATTASGDLPPVGPGGAQAAASPVPAGEEVEDSASSRHVAFSAVGAGYGTPILDSIRRALPDICASQDRDGHSLLHVAAHANNSDAARWLLRADPDLAAQPDDSGFLPVHTAAARNALDVLSVLVDADPASVSAKDAVERAPLAVAAAAGALDAVAHLVKKHGARVNGRDAFGNTALHWAAAHGHFRVVQMLVKQGSDVHPLCYSGRTAGELARERGHADVHDWLTSRIADMKALSSAVKRGDVEAARDILNSADLLVRDADGRTALHIAASKGQDRAVAVLLEHRYKCADRDKFHRLPLHWAAARGHVATAHALVLHSRAQRAQRAAAAAAAAVAAGEASGDGAGTAAGGNGGNGNGGGNGGSGGGGGGGADGRLLLAERSLTERTAEELAAEAGGDAAEVGRALAQALRAARELEQAGTAATPAQAEAEAEAWAWARQVVETRRRRREAGGQTGGPAGGSLTGFGDPAAVAVGGSAAVPAAAAPSPAHVPTPHAGDADRADAGSVLSEFGLADVAERILDDGFDSRKRLAFIEDKDLEKLGVKPGHRRELLDWAAREQESKSRAASQHQHAQVQHAQYQQQAQIQQHQFQQQQQQQLHGHQQAQQAQQERKQFQQFQQHERQAQAQAQAQAQGFAAEGAGPAADAAFRPQPAGLTPMTTPVSTPVHTPMHTPTNGGSRRPGAGMTYAAALGVGRRDDDRPMEGRE